MFMLLHELSHIHHRDTWWILLISALRALYWFNPLVWIGSYYAICDLELRCDEEVLAQCGTDKAPAYAKNLVDTARGSKPQTTYACSTYISRALKERIKAIMKMKKRNLKTQIIGVILLLILISTAIFGMEALVQKDHPVAAELAETMNRTEKTRESSEQAAYEVIGMPTFADNWQMNERGETFGSLDPDAKTVEEAYPDLLGAIGENDVFGYLRLKERLLAQPNPKNFTSDESWPLYAEDGVTIVGRFIPAKADVTHFNQD